MISADDHELDGFNGIWDVKGSLYPLDAVPSKAAPHLQFSVKSKNSNVKVWLSNTTTNRSVSSVVTRRDASFRLRVPPRPIGKGGGRGNGSVGEA